ncbi:unnamed protein product [Mytilus edulis]|uniref:MULE transposase domain-containing protein n=1 Tax=Mytilus edulis TaxID=6550 RepID=A0A8S3S137_MYTED|nr:unnamed protein product [Mytilus edulis]
MSDIGDYESVTESMNFVVNETICSSPNAKPPPSPKESECTSPLSVSSTDIEPTSSDNDVTFPKPDNTNTLQHGKFLSALDCWKAVQDKSHIFEDAPPGNKSNTWFLVNNVDNMSRKTSNRHSKYYDDCGIWESSKGKVFHQDYLLSDNFRTIFLKNDQYCTKVRQGGKTLFVPITPQPDSESIVTMHRYSTVLKENNSFKKHVTWFNSSFDNDLPSIAVYEYSGTYCLENAKNYVRTHPKTLDKVVDECALKDNKEVFIQMNRDNSLHAPRDTKQIRNAKYRNKLKTHPFVQQIIHNKNQVPAIVCYTDNQITDLRHFLAQKSEHPLGVDRTFNLGSFYVTSIVYKNLRVNRKETKDHPIFAGPMLLHKDASYKTYRAFFSNISATLELPINDVELRLHENIEFGSDDEKAMTKAIENAFPTAKRRLCTKHLKDNVQHYLQDRVGVSTQERKTIINTIFGDQGIASADDTLQFARADSELKDLCANHPQFLKYYEQSFKPRVEEFVNAPNRRLGTKQMWTNNNAESMNRVMKVAVNWKPQHAPDLVDKLFDMVDFQFINLRSALHHSGDYMLVNSYKQYTIADAIWKTKSDEEKRKLFNNFLQDSIKKENTKIS